MSAISKARLCFVFVLAATPLLAAEPWEPISRHLPPAGIEIPAADRDRLGAGLARLQRRRDDWLASEPDGFLKLGLPDVDIYLKAVRFALEESEFYGSEDVAAADDLLQACESRLDDLAAERAIWTLARGPVVQGYRSPIDDSVQPYGLVIPEKLDLSKPVPLYVWLHGRNDKLTDLRFISERSRNYGQVHPDDAIVLHPFGRGCLGWKSAAERDVLDAINVVYLRYRIDPKRIVLLGFSMGGAGAWHIGAHYTDRFAGVHAGAGFVDVARYQKLTPDEFPATYEQTLWDVYDVPKYVRNLFNLPVVAYSGEFDKQKQAADIMAEAFRSEGRELTHLIGPGMGHKYDPAVLAQVMKRMRAAAVQGRGEASPALSFQTRTLRYNDLHWIRVNELDEHWQDSRVDAHYPEAEQLFVKTKNIRLLELKPPLPVETFVIDEQEFSAPFPLGESRSILFDPPFILRKENQRWRFVQTDKTEPGRKRPGLQGPIDDVLLEPFLVVTPTGNSTPEIDRWVAFELEHFRRRWKNVYRGELREVRDIDLTQEEIERYHLICWGDPTSNSILRKVANRLPIARKEEMLRLGSQQFDSTHHLPLAISPNPLNPLRYLVQNSGPTHREAHDRTNSLQNPKLGDWAIVDVRFAPDAERPGRVVAAGIFDEFWALPAQVSKAEE
jgi:predicted esterase